MQQMPLEILSLRMTNVHVSFQLHYNTCKKSFCWNQCKNSNSINVNKNVLYMQYHQQNSSCEIHSKVEWKKQTLYSKLMEKNINEATSYNMFIVIIINSKHTHDNYSEVDGKTENWTVSIKTGSPRKVHSIQWRWWEFSWRYHGRIWQL